MIQHVKYVPSRRKDFIMAESWDEMRWDEMMTWKQRGPAEPLEKFHQLCTSIYRCSRTPAPNMQGSATDDRSDSENKIPAVVPPHTWLALVSSCELSHLRYRPVAGWNARCRNLAVQLQLRFCGIYFASEAQLIAYMLLYFDLSSEK